MLYAASIFLVIMVYTIIMQMLGVTKFISFNKGWLDIIKVGLPVAIIEELFFRLGVISLLFYLGATEELALFSSALFFSFCHFTWGMYSRGGEYKTLIENTLLTIGLTIFGYICGKFYLTTGTILYGVIFHSMAIYAVQLLLKNARNEGQKYLWLFDNGHQILRSPIIWAIMLVYAQFI